METGQRKDTSTGKLVPLQFIRHFLVSANIVAGGRTTQYGECQKIPSLHSRRARPESGKGKLLVQLSRSAATNGSDEGIVTNT
ncbi:MAG: thiosulfate oxidation carrier complex protein SoxZ [Betaproteobacteria bacterium]|uniref:Thiosulfate oxidation carrier complex protein SoxZ n=1 Tax=Candidatus Proximibacter danicus TaxID=2954365 RepID=A0A9D7K2Z0_9PROT|nr:thiosulfate oxidation carrier complex protein SoxZ [Candidatus Proximibacter danicus]